MASKKKRLKRMVEETIETLHENFGKRLASVKWYHVTSSWIAPHSEAVIIVEVKRANKDLYSNLYDIVYKEMSSKNFEYMLSLQIKEYIENEYIEEEGMKKEEVLSEDKGVVLCEVV